MSNNPSYPVCVLLGSNFALHTGQSKCALNVLLSRAPRRIMHARRRNINNRAAPSSRTHIIVWYLILSIDSLFYAFAAAPNMCQSMCVHAAADKESARKMNLPLMPREWMKKMRENSAAQTMLIHMRQCAAVMRRVLAAGKKDSSIIFSLTLALHLSQGSFFRHFSRDAASGEILLAAAHGEFLCKCICLVFSPQLYERNGWERMSSSASLSLRWALDGHFLSRTWDPRTKKQQRIFMSASFLFTSAVVHMRPYHLWEHSSCQKTLEPIEKHPYGQVSARGAQKYTLCWLLKAKTFSWNMACLIIFKFFFSYFLHIIFDRVRRFTISTYTQAFFSTSTKKGWNIC